MLKKKKTTASGKLVLVKSVRRTRSHRMKFCVQKGAWGHCPQQADGRQCECVCINTHIACPSCVWLSTRIACLSYLTRNQQIPKMGLEIALLKI